MLQQGSLSNIFICVKGRRVCKKWVLKHYFWPTKVFLSQDTTDKEMRQSVCLEKKKKKTKMEKVFRNAVKTQNVIKITDGTAT